MARLTKAEKGLILHMIGIAEGGERSEGDYQEWTEKDYDRLDSIASKLSTPAKREG